MKTDEETSRGKRPEDHEEWCAFWSSDGDERCDCPPSIGLMSIDAEPHDDDEG